MSEEELKYRTSPMNMEIKRGGPDSAPTIDERIRDSDSPLYTIYIHAHI